MKLFLYQIRTKKKRRELDVLVHASGKRAAEEMLEGKYAGHTRIRTTALGNVPKHFVVGEYEAQPAPRATVSIEELGLPMHALRALQAEGIGSVQDLVQRTPAELRSIPNLGRISLDHVVDLLQRRGMKLKSD